MPSTYRALARADAGKATLPSADNTCSIDRRPSAKGARIPRTATAPNQASRPPPTLLVLAKTPSLPAGYRDPAQIVPATLPAAFPSTPARPLPPAPGSIARVAPGICPPRPTPRASPTHIVGPSPADGSVPPHPVPSPRPATCLPGARVTAALRSVRVSHSRTPTPQPPT